MQARDILAIKGMALYTMAPEQKLREAAALMSERDIGSIVCVENGQMVGMLTFAEVINAVNRSGDTWSNVRLADIMKGNPLSSNADAQVDDLRRLMVAHGIRYLPVMDGITPLGVISFHDVARAVLEEQSFEGRMLKAYVRDWPEEPAEHK